MRTGFTSAAVRVTAGALVAVLLLSNIPAVTPRPQPPFIGPPATPGEPVRPAPPSLDPPAPPPTTTSGPPPEPARPDPEPTRPAKDPMPACGVASAGALERWISQASAALEYAGEAPITDRAALRIIITAESSGDPCAYNGWDINAKRGTPSIGLIQTIRPTFDRWKLPGYDNMRHPVDNIVAGVRYARGRYGSESKVPGVLGRRTGGGYSGY
ncbi:transglycosylase SLT domain-containing protein [Amycolatopsis sp. NPDC059021]|uniref:transglycosylase SLT domain-containing protein n=1 Tax=Amycolatopsis sp. NPDC059021 TaxID=3346704 RepID=UPI003672265D